MKTPKLISIVLFLLVSTLLFAQEADENNALLTVKVTSPSGEKKVGEKVSFKSNKTKKNITGITNAEGFFKVLLPKGDTYAIKLMSFENDVKFSDLEVPNQAGLMEFEYTITYSLPTTYVLENVFFDSGKSTLKSSSFKSLNSLAELLKTKKTLIIEIGGHTDNVGKPEANLTLSKRRADAVKNYLVRKGVNAQQIKTKGYGDTVPVADNSSSQGRQQNRRTQITILKQ